MSFRVYRNEKSHITFKRNGKKIVSFQVKSLHEGNVTGKLGSTRLRKDECVTVTEVSPETTICLESVFKAKDYVLRASFIIDGCPEGVIVF